MKPLPVDEKFPGFDYHYQRLVSSYGSKTVNERKIWIGWTLSLSFVLATIASLPDIMSIWNVKLGIPPLLFSLIGVPAALLVFANLVVLSGASRFSSAKIFAYKATYPHKRRIRDTVLGLGAMVTLMILLRGSLPDGFGGVLVTCAVLTSYNLFRRTPEEIDLAKAGLPDPRDLYLEDEKEGDK